MKKTILTVAATAALLSFSTDALAQATISTFNKAGKPVEKKIDARKDNFRSEKDRDDRAVTSRPGKQGRSALKRDFDISPEDRRARFEKLAAENPEAARKYLKSNPNFAEKHFKGNAEARKRFMENHPNAAEKIKAKRAEIRENRAAKRQDIIEGRAERRQNIKSNVNDRLETRADRRDNREGNKESFRRRANQDGIDGAGAKKSLSNKASGSKANRNVKKKVRKNRN